jgi:hypothetical protein
MARSNVVNAAKAAPAKKIADKPESIRAINAAFVAGAPSAPDPTPAPPPAPPAPVAPVAAAPTIPADVVDANPPTPSSVVEYAAAMRAQRDAAHRMIGQLSALIAESAKLLEKLERVEGDADPNIRAVARKIFSEATATQHAAVEAARRSLNAAARDSNDVRARLVPPRKSKTTTDATTPAVAE